MDERLRACAEENRRLRDMLHEMTQERDDYKREAREYRERLKIAEADKWEIERAHVRLTSQALEMKIQLEEVAR